MSAWRTPPASPRAAWHWLEGKIVYSVSFGIVVLLLAGAGLFYYTARHPPDRVVKIAYAAGGQARKYFLEQMALEGRKHHLDIRLVATDGAAQTRSLIVQDAVDMGLIPGAVEERGTQEVFEVAPLYVEALQLVVKGELYDDVSRDFGALKGKSIDLLSPDSATYLLGTELLRFIGLGDPAHPQYRPVYVMRSQPLQTGAATLPDAIFQIAAVPSPALRTLINDFHYRLVPLPFGPSFNLDKFLAIEAPDPVGSSSLRLDKTFIEEFVIPPYAYSVLPPVPPADTRTIATRLLLIGSPKMENHVVREVLDLLMSPAISALSKPPLTVDVLSGNFQFERHPGTEAYLEALKPFNLDFAFDTYSRMGELWGLIIAVYLAAAKGLKAWRARKEGRERGSVGDFMSQVLAVEALAHATCSDAERIRLDQRLTDIKRAAIELHLDERLKDGEELPSLLATLADTRTRVLGLASDLGSRSGPSFT